MDKEKKRGLADAIGYGVQSARLERDSLVESRDALQEIVQEEALLLGKTEMKEKDHDSLRKIGFLIEAFERIISVGEEAMAELDGTPVDGAPTYFSDEVKHHDE